MTKKINNPFLNAQKQVQNASKISGKYEEIKQELEIISNPKRIIEVNIPVRMDNWDIKTFVWYRSQHNDSRWPFKWWIRFHQDVNLDEVKALSMWMTFKTWVLDLPLWGWKWGIIVNPKELSDKELENLSRWYVRQLYKYIGPEQDVPAPDVNTNPKIMAWMMDEYSKLVGKYSPWSFTGKPLSSWGSKWRWKATAQWWVYSLLKILELEKKDITWKTFIVQWAGNAGLTFADILTGLWAKLIWISDSKWAIFNEKGIDIEEIQKLKQNRKSVVDYSDKAEIVSNEEILEKTCDILVPAALENQITSENAKNIKAKIILELANWPTTPEADDILFEKWIEIIPDILANAGWVTVSYFEQVQNNANFYWEEEEIEEKLKKRMEKATTDVFEKAKELNTSFRNSAYIISIERVVSAIKDRWDY